MLTTCAATSTHRLMQGLEDAELWRSETHACECKDPQTRTCMREPEASWMSRMTRPSLPSRLPTSHVCSMNLTLYWPFRVLCTIAEYVSNIVASTSPSVGKPLQAIRTP